MREEGGATIASAFTVFQDVRRGGDDFQPVLHVVPCECSMYAELGRPQVATETSRYSCLRAAPKPFLAVGAV